jgi:hypothetical protein
MSAYAVAHLRTVALGPEIFEYIARIDATLEPFGGRFLIHGGPVDAMDGNWSGDLVVIAFRDVGPLTPGTRLRAIRPFCGCAPTIRMATPSSSMACRMGTRLPTRSRSWFPPRPPDVMGVGENLFPRNYACPICRLYPVVQASKNKMNQRSWYCHRNYQTIGAQHPAGDLRYGRLLQSAQAGSRRSEPLWAIVSRYRLTETGLA